MPLDILIEGLLFYKASSVKKAFLIKQFSLSADDLTVALTALSTRLESGAIRLLETETEVQLVTAPALAPFIDEMQKADLKHDIGKAGAETLAIILYQGSVSRAEIDRIRGVNSSFILRNLLIRGLIERTSAKVGNGFNFSITPALLSQLGVLNTQSLTDFANITNTLETFVHDTDIVNDTSL